MPLDPISSHLERVAARLNRVAVQRALYSSLGLGALLIALGILAFAWLPRSIFPFLGTALGLLWLTVVVRAVREVTTGWAQKREAALWVERRVDLDQRLITLVNVRGDPSTTPLQEELVADNYTFLPTWQDEKLGIPAIPLEISLLALGLLALALALTTWKPDPMDQPPPLRSQSQAPGSPHGAMAREGSGRTLSAVLPGNRAAPTGPGVATTAGGAGESNPESTNTQISAGATLAQKRKPSSMPPPQEIPTTRQPPALANGPGIGSFSESGTAARRRNTATSNKDEKFSQAQMPNTGDSGKSSLSQQDSKDSNAADPANETTQVARGTGARPGDAPGTGPLFADAPLDRVSGSRDSDFALALGANAGRDPGGRGAPTQMRSSIARGQTTAQHADQPIRRQNIPPEYENALRRIFERNP